MPRNVNAASTSETMAALDCVSSISRLRFHASATTPLNIDRQTIGTTRTRPTRPSANAFFSGHSSDTCHNSPAFCIIDPVTDASRPIQINRKLRWVSATKCSRATTVVPVARATPVVSDDADRRFTSRSGLEGANDRMRLVQLFEILAILGRQLHLQR